MNAPIPIGKLPNKLPFLAVTPAMDFLKPEDFSVFRLHRRYRCFVNYVFQYTDCELADLIQVADRRYRPQSKRHLYEAVVGSIAQEQRLRAFDTPLHRQLRFLLACRNSDQNLFITAKVERFGSRHAPHSVSLKDYAPHLPDDGLGIMDFFKSKREFQQLGLYQRDKGYHADSASDTELTALEAELQAWLLEKSAPSRHAYRARVLTQIQDEIQRRAHGEEPEARFVRLIHRGAVNLATLERAGWDIAKFFAQRGMATG